MERRLEITRRRELDYRRVFSRDEWVAALRGVRAQTMDDKWDIEIRGDRIWFVRSWTGLVGYEVAVEPDGDGMRVCGAWYDADVLSWEPEQAGRMLGEVVELVLLG